MKNINIFTFGESVIVSDYIKRLRVNYRASYQTLDFKNRPLKPKTANFNIVIGQKAFQHYLLMNITTPALVVFVKKNTFYHSIKNTEHKYLTEGLVINHDHIGAVYSDPLLAHQIKLIEKLIGEHSSFGVMLSPRTAFMRSELEKLAESNNLNVKFVLHDSESNIHQSINSLREQAAILAIPDKLIWNNKYIKNIILSSYKNEQPIIGFSRNLVQAGSAATTYADLDSIIKETLDRLNSHFNHNQKPITRSSYYFALAINNAVIRSLNMHPPKM